MAQWVACLTCDRWIPVSREFEPHQRPPLFPWARNFTLLSTGCYQEPIRAWFTEAKITMMINVHCFTQILQEILVLPSRSWRSPRCPTIFQRYHHTWPIPRNQGPNQAERLLYKGNYSHKFYRSGGFFGHLNHTEHFALYLRVSMFDRAGLVQCLMLLTRNGWHILVWTTLKASVVSMYKKLYPYCSVLVGSRDGYELLVNVCQLLMF